MRGPRWASLLALIGVVACTATPAPTITAGPTISPAPSPAATDSPSPTFTLQPTDEPTAGPTSTPTLMPTSPPPPTSSPALPTPSPSPTSTPVPGPNEYVTVAQMNLWFHGPGCYGGFEAFDCSGKRTTTLTPLLGATYDSASADVIRQQIDWAADYGVDAFSVEWTTPRSVPGSIEPVLDDNFLRAPNLSTVRWCIFYDLVLRLDQTPGLNVDLSRGMDFDNPDVYDTFVSDFEHFADKYFDQPQYLKIDQRPVVYIWGTWNAIGRYTQAFEEARQKVAERGFDVYIVGDIIRADQFTRRLASAYDASTNFLFFMSGSPPLSDVGEAATSLDHILGSWESDISGLRVDGRDDHVALQPGLAPQYDDRLFRSVNHISSPTYIPATSRRQVVKMAQVVRDHAQPAGSDGMKLVWLNTWNNWAETTTFEPTADLGSKYPAGNYQFDMLEVIRDVFGAKTFSN